MAAPRVPLGRTHQWAPGEAQSGQGIQFGADVFAQLKVLKDAETEGRIVVRRRVVQEFVVPAVDQQGTALDRCDGFLPLVTPREHAALDNTTAERAEESCTQIRQRLRHVRGLHD